MVRKEAEFHLGDILTPDHAAKLATLTEHFSAKLLLECEGKRVLLDSLIGILSLDCPRGTRLTVIAEGEDEQKAAEAVASMLEGRQ